MVGNLFMTVQFEMKRTQRVTFTQEEADNINAAIATIEHFGGTATPNKFIKRAAVEEAKAINNNGDKNA